MEKKSTYGFIYSFIQIHLVWGFSEGTFDEKGVIYASPGMDVNLTCQTQKSSSLVQTQWSKITNSIEMIALYHPQYGYHCSAQTSCESLVSFTKLSPDVSEWALHLRNVSAEMSGRYECSFTLYPEGTWTRVQDFLVQTEVAQNERGGNYTVEVLFNHTLEIPCFQNISSAVSSGVTVDWLMEEKGMQATLTQNNTFLKNRIVLLKDHGLYLSSVEIFDDDRKFSCHVTFQSGKILKNVTRIKVFAKPEISINMQKSSIDVLEEKKFSCLVRNVFPMANLSWYLDGELQNEKEGIYITTGRRNSDEGFYELTSKLRFLKPNQPIQPNNLTIWCMTLFPVPGNEVWNISSRKIAFSFEYLSTSSPTLEEMSSTPSNPDSTSHSHQFDSNATIQSYLDHGKMETEPTYQFNSSVTTQSYPDHSTKETEPSHQFNSNITTQSYPDRSMKETEPNLWLFTLSYNSTSSGSDITLNGTVSNKPNSGTSWPVVVAGLLFICIFLFGLGIRKWCQYWKEIMERPPPFKPPPPPIKYTCIGESVGGDLPCHEMETL
ncbi:T-cell surface protein tactile [Petaurus breviceps papuanus]|uniref:T-cell surface protein tactile n=1 Tax=Petaurus breviceps papuanus TaxID=3040969 RepID=UPI0036D8E3CE